MTPMKAIRAKCLDCCGGQVNVVKACPCPDCSLYPFRLGKNPNLQQKRTPAQLEALKRGRAPFSNVDNPRNFERPATSEGSYTPDTRAGENRPIN